MNSYRIENTVSGHILGIYRGETPEDALDALAKDAGYTDRSDMDEAVSVLPGEILVIEVADEGDPDNACL